MEEITFIKDIPFPEAKKLHFWLDQFWGEVPEDMGRKRNSQGQIVTLLRDAEVLPNQKLLASK